MTHTGNQKQAENQFDVTMENSPILLSIEEAASTLRLSPWTIRRHLTEGKLKAVRIGRRVLLEPAELQRLVEAGRKPSIPAPVVEHGRDDVHQQ